MTPTNVRLPPDITIYSAPGYRSPYALMRVIEQFDVATSRRYAVRDTNGDGKPDTHCDAFACDVSLAMGVVLPSEIKPDGDPAEALHGRELNANDTIRWLRQHGPRFGWKHVNESEARAAANAGHMALATWLHLGGRGHLAVLRPSDSDRTLIAQAGAHNFEKGTLAQGFGSHALECEFWIND